MEALQVLGALLDVLDTTGTVLALMAVWYTWIAPPRVAPEVLALELEPFLQAVAAAPAPPNAATADPAGDPAPDDRESAQAATGS